MTALRSPFRSSAFQSFALCAMLCLPFISAHAETETNDAASVSPKGIHCDARMDKTGADWTALTQFLGSRGLTLATQCSDASGVVTARLVVQDSSKASEVLRGPLADGEMVETGGTQNVHVSVKAEADQWSPDVHHNRTWLALALKQHHFSLLAAGSLSNQANPAVTHLALR